MAYSELIKSFDRIRDYMRQFYVYGFKSRTEYNKKSARSYDNERRRIESWLGDYMRFRQTPDGKHVFLSVNLGRIQRCVLLEPCAEAEYCPKPLKKRKLILELTDTRNALERAMLHFSHLDKQTERLEDGRYRITLFYERGDETELLIRVLSFGPVVQVIFPDDFLKKLRERLEKQKNLRTQR